MNSMAANTGNTAGGQTAPSHRPVPRPRGVQSPPTLPAKVSENSERDVETRLGIVSQTSFDLPLPAPPDFSEQPFVPKPAPGSEDMPAAIAKDKKKYHHYVNVDELDKPAPGSENMSAAAAKDTKKYQHYVNVELDKPGPRSEEMTAVVAIKDTEEDHLFKNGKELDKYGNATVENNTVPTSSPLSTATEPSDVSAGESVNQTEALRRRQFPALAEASGAKGNRMSQLAKSDRVSRFLDVVERSNKFEKPAPAQKIGQLVVPKGLERKLTTVLVRQRTIRAKQEVDDQSDVGIDVAAGETSARSTKPSVTSSDSTRSPRSHTEDSKSMLHTVKYSS